ncbi:MAG TPA: SGNH/GDSL hydrolase family protein [Vicinamibacteria bacterium]|nr:SGNH/GDSL hydrolase family protein [Vicinamibacteria bacterium]
MLAAAGARRALVGGVALALASGLGTLLALEAACRVRSRLAGRPEPDAAPRRPSALERGRAAGLGDIVRTSRNPDIVYELRPGLDVTFLGRRLSTSAAGFRDREYQPAKPPGVHRILGLGDSVMFGWGVADGEDYLSRVEERLAEEQPLERWQVINMAVPGYNAVMEVETLHERGLAYGPDLVIVGFCGNDMRLPNFLRAPEDFLALDRSYLFDFVRSRLGGADLEDSDASLAPLTIRGPDRDMVPPRYAHMVGLAAYERSMQRLRETKQREGFEVVVLFYPGPAKGVAPIVRRLGFRVLSLATRVRSFLREQGGREAGYAKLRLSSRDPHPSPVGHRLIADGLVAYLDESGLRARLAARGGPGEHRRP